MDVQIFGGEEGRFRGLRADDRWRGWSRLPSDLGWTGGL